MTILTQIQKAIKDFPTRPNKILMSFKDWQQMTQEENLMTKYCTACNTFLKPSETLCNLCKSDNTLIDKPLPIMTIEGLPFEVSSNIQHIKVI